MDKETIEKLLLDKDNTRSAHSKVKICVSGAADTSHCGEGALDIALEVGQEIARQGGVIVTGATTGFPLWSAKEPRNLVVFLWVYHPLRLKKSMLRVMVCLWITWILLFIQGRVFRGVIFCLLARLMPLFWVVDELALFMNLQWLLRIINPWEFWKVLG